MSLSSSHKAQDVAKKFILEPRTELSNNINFLETSFALLNAVVNKTNAHLIRAGVFYCNLCLMQAENNHKRG